ncbi:MAG: hypothetical protein H0X41_10395 [Chitinophagaceae bacterium]|nr:hypothetical protein [Chitinophagaceae bacterium]
MEPGKSSSIFHFISYPNYIPLRKKEIIAISDSLSPFAFDTIYGAFGRVIRQ